MQDVMNLLCQFVFVPRGVDMSAYMTEQAVFGDEENKIVIVSGGEEEYNSFISQHTCHYTENFDRWAICTGYLRSVSGYKTLKVAVPDAEHLVSYVFFDGMLNEKSRRFLVGALPAFQRQIIQRQKMTAEEMHICADLANPDVRWEDAVNRLRGVAHGAC